MKNCLFLLMAALATPLAAAVPNRITYQGRLTKSGISSAGPHTFIACLTNGASNLWCDPGQTLTLPVSGDFTLILQPNIPIDWINNAVKLKLTVDGQALSPSDDFTSVPYAIIASSAAFASQAGTAASAQSAASLTGTLPASQVQLSGVTTLDSWQSTISPTLISAAKIDGPIAGQWINAPGNALYYSAGNVGIGTSAPAYPLHIKGFAGPGWTMEVQSSHATNNGVVLLGSRAPGSGAIQSTDAGGSVKPLLLNPDGGNVSVGTTSPAFPLDVNGFIRAIGADGRVLLRSNARSEQWALIGTSAGDFRITEVNGAGGSLQDAVTVKQTSGNVGIGTDVPAEKLDVNGNATISGTIRGASWGFGGMYSANDCDLGTPASSVNPITGGFSCPAGFTDTWIQRSLGAEVRCGVNLHMCWK